MKLRLFNFDLVIEFSFLLIISFALAFGADNVIGLLVFSSLHEIGHIIALLSVGGKIDNITLSFYGLALNYSCMLSRNKELLVIICGPLLNFVLYLVLKNEINLLLFVINSLPIYPLDGGRILAMVFPKWSRAVSIVTLVMISVLSLYLIVFYKSFSLVLISLYLIVYSLRY